MEMNRTIWWREALAVALLLAAVAVAWCGANAKWSAAEWRLPTAYGDLQRSDVLQHLAFIKAARDGDFVPLRSKVVRALGAPGTGNWNDWPIVEELPIFALGVLARGVGIFAALNAFVLLGHLLAGAAFYGVARVNRVAMEWAWVGAWAFGLAPFLFAQSPHHPFVEWCWHVPLLLLVWRWVATEPGVVPGSRRFWAGMGIGLLAGVQMVYYTAIFAQLVLLGALVMFARTRAWRPLLSALLFIAAAAAGFALMNVDTWMYRWAHGPNDGALLRPYGWLEVYGLGLVNGFVPLVEHRWEVFRGLAEWHLKARVLADEGSYFGIVGGAAVVFLAGAATWAVVRRRAEGVPREAWQVLWIGVFFVPGGLNALAGLAGFTFLRTGCRYSVVILAIALMFAAERLSGLRERRRVVGMAVAMGLAGLVWWDQVPRTPDAGARETIARMVAADREFVAELEGALPAGAMVFQIPAMDYPEAPAAGMSAAEHFRPYLHAERLRFSFGTNKGRSDGAWQRELDKLPLAEVVRVIREKGFAALCIDRKGFPDRGVGLLGALAQLGYGRRVGGDEDDLVAVLL